MIYKNKSIQCKHKPFRRGDSMFSTLVTSLHEYDPFNYPSKLQTDRNAITFEALVYSKTRLKKKQLRQIYLYYYHELLIQVIFYWLTV